MWMVLLYGVATFMETGVGVWMFGRMFPERKSSSEYRWAKMILLTLLILTTYTMHRAYGQEYIYEKFFFIVVYAGVMISDAILYKYRDFFRINKKTEKIILFSYISIMLTWQYWVSYVSFGIIAIANLYLPFFLLTVGSSTLGRTFTFEASIISGLYSCSTTTVRFMVVSLGWVVWA